MKIAVLALYLIGSAESESLWSDCWDFIASNKAMRLGITDCR